MKSVEAKIAEKIKKIPKGKLIFPEDFQELGTSEAVRLALHRLEKETTITRVAQGIPYYEKFIEHFPTVQQLANADEQTVLMLWQGLGYYSRARNLHAAAKYILEELNGIFPTTASFPFKAYLSAKAKEV